jgi:hypothetical protein
MADMQECGILENIVMVEVHVQSECTAANKQTTHNNMPGLNVYA